MRTDNPIDQAELRRRQSSEIAGFYGDVHIASVAESIDEAEGNLQQRENWFKHQFGG